MFPNRFRCILKNQLDYNSYFLVELCYIFLKFYVAHLISLFWSSCICFFHFFSFSSPFFFVSSSFSLCMYVTLWQFVWTGRFFVCVCVCLRYKLNNWKLIKVYWKEYALDFISEALQRIISLNCYNIIGGNLTRRIYHFFFLSIYKFHSVWSKFFKKSQEK